MKQWRRFVAFAAMLVVAEVVVAAELRGTVTGIDGSSVIITLDSDLRPRAGDRVEISFKTSDDEIPVGTWQVSKVDGTTVTATPVEIDGEATIDMVAVIYSEAARVEPPPAPAIANPVRSPPPAPPEVATRPAIEIRPSFNCRLARLPAEIAICDSPALAELDRTMAQTYFAQRNRSSGHMQSELRRLQRQWLQRRNACGFDFGCLEQIHLEHIRFLQRWPG